MKSTACVKNKSLIAVVGTDKRKWEGEQRETSKSYVEELRS